MLEKSETKSDISFIEKNSDILIKKYFSFFKKNFKNNKFNKLYNTDIFEFNLYKHNIEILSFLSFLSKKKVN